MIAGCPICESSDTRVLLAWNRQTSIALCGACDLRFASPRPTDEELSDFYQGFLYRKPDRRQIERLIGKRTRDLRRLFGWSTGQPGPRTFLDFGGGTGVAFQAARILGLDAYCCDIDEDACAFVREEFGATNTSVSTAISSLAREAFDFILADNVIEHVSESVALMESIAGLLVPGGVAVLKTPYGGSGELFFYPKILILGYARKALRYNGLFKALSILTTRRIWTCDPPRHLFAFTPGSLETIARRLRAKAFACQIEYYRIPLLQYSLLKAIASRPAGIGGVLKRLILCPLLPVELAAKCMQLILRLMRFPTPGGLILRVTREGRTEDPSPTARD